MEQTMDPKSAYLARPWLRYYEPGVPPDVEVPACSVADLFDAATEKFAA